MFVAVLQKQNWCHRPRADSAQDVTFEPQGRRVPFKFSSPPFVFVEGTGLLDIMEACLRLVAGPLFKHPAT
jgi:hypothetical protein